MSTEMYGSHLLEKNSLLKESSKINKLTSVFHASVLLLIINFNNRTDSLKTDINLFFTITNGRIARSRSLTPRTNSKFMCLSAY